MNRNGYGSKRLFSNLHYCTGICLDELTKTGHPQSGQPVSGWRFGHRIPLDRRLYRYHEANMNINYAAQQDGTRPVECMYLSLSLLLRNRSQVD
jgi:hypothetical protein